MSSGSGSSGGASFGATPTPPSARLPGAGNGDGDDEPPDERSARIPKQWSVPFSDPFLKPRAQQHNWRQLQTESLKLVFVEHERFQLDSSEEDDKVDMESEDLETPVEQMKSTFNLMGFTMEPGTSARYGRLQLCNANRVAHCVNPLLQLSCNCNVEKIAPWSSR